ncbi:hypothetical protein ACLOJK_002739 [Asimina triloba]
MKTCTYFGYEDRCEVESINIVRRRGKGAEVEMGALIERYKASIAMVALQFAYAAMSLFSRAALTQGMSPRVFVVYRQAVATIFLAPIAYCARR